MQSLVQIIDWVRQGEDTAAAVGASEALRCLPACLSA